MAIAADTPANEWKHYVKVGLQEMKQIFKQELEHFN